MTIDDFSGTHTKTLTRILILNQIKLMKLNEIEDRKNKKGRRKFRVKNI